jgi:ABC-type oligopeptide transport system ATPase subunit
MSKDFKRLRQLRTPTWYDTATRWTQLTLVEDDPQSYDLALWLRIFDETASNATCLSAGGYVAYYPSQIPLHHVSRFVGDTYPFGDLVAGARARNMHVVARVDPHAVHADVAAAHPEWISVTAEGQPRKHWSFPDAYIKVDAIFHGATHPYTQRLLSSVLKLEHASDLKRQPAETDQRPILSVRNLAKSFSASKGIFRAKTAVDVKAVDGVSFDLMAGESLGIVGESGSGKTTLGRLILRVVEPTSGQIGYAPDDAAPTDVRSLDLRGLHGYHQQVRLIFQDPFASLNPRMTVKQIIGIARALALNPRILIADEATSALDVSIRSQMLDLLLSLQQKLGLSVLFISQDIGVVRYFCDRVAVMRRGKIVEIGPAETICTSPEHPYTKALISAVPRPDPRHPRMKTRTRFQA